MHKSCNKKISVIPEKNDKTIPAMHKENGKTKTEIPEKFSKMVSALLLAVLLLTNLIFSSSCKPKYTAYTYQFLGTFDTAVSLVGHMTSQKEFDKFSAYAEKRFNELNKLYDIYHDYDGVINIKTINDNAGIAPVTVRKEIIDLLAQSKAWYKKTNGKVNIALGSVLKIWHDARTYANDNPQLTDPPVPTLQELQAANEHVSIDSLVLDTEKSTVFIQDPKVQLDVGAVAKGYTTEIVANELSALGYNSFAISAGGNVKVVGKPLAKDRDTWIIGIQNPQPDVSSDPNEGIINKVAVNDTSVVTSGWYQRYFISGGKIYHHIIDPDTLFPQNYYRAVTIVYPDSGIADILSTAVMLMPYEDAVKFAATIPGVEVYFILFNGDVRTTKGMDAILMDKGNAGSSSDSTTGSASTPSSTSASR